MYAIINAGGKQAKVRPGDVLDVELLKTDDETIDFEPLLVVDDGSVISDAKALAKLSVSARILGEVKGPKIDIFKYKNKTGYRRRMGHRQRYTQVEVLAIGSAKDQKAKKPPTAEKVAKATTATKAEATTPAAEKLDSSEEE